jgi:ATP-dependent Clp protease ATP-binding subunit ClpC
LDDGVLTDSLGHKVSFKNTIIIMTSNTGSRQLKEFGTGVGFVTKTREKNADDESKLVIDRQLKKTFAPEFLNRIDDIVTFNSLDKEDIKKIVDIELEGLLLRVSGLEYELELTNDIRDYIVEKGFDVEYGARPLKRAIQRYVEDELTEELINSNPEKGSKLIMNYDKVADKIVIQTKKKKTRKKE